MVDFRGDSAEKQEVPSGAPAAQAPLVSACGLTCLDFPNHSSNMSKRASNRAGYLTSFLCSWHIHSWVSIPGCSCLYKHIHNTHTHTEKEGGEGEGVGNE